MQYAQYSTVLYIQLLPPKCAGWGGSGKEGLLPGLPECNPPARVITCMHTNKQYHRTVLHCNPHSYRTVFEG